jgi:hypothetical protein
MFDPAPTPPGPQPQQEFLRAFLDQRDISCPCCSYNLRDLKFERCPECNQPLQLQVGLLHPRLAWFIAGLIGIGMNLGFCALILGWVLFILLFKRRSGIPPRSDLVPLALGTVAAALVLWLWVRSRPKLAPKGLSLRWFLALTATAFCFLFTLWFFAVAR